MRTGGRRNWAGKLLPWVLLAASPGCGGPASPDPPRPALEAVEPLVARRILSAREAVTRDPGSAEAWGRLGEVFDVHDLTAEAVFCYEQAARLDASEWRWPYFTGILLRASDQRRALAAFERAAELAPDYPPIQFYIGYGRFLTEDLQGAEQAYLRALELDPELVDALLGLARIDLARGEPGAARERLERAVRIAGNEAAVYEHLETIDRALGDAASAERAARRAAGARPAQAGGMAALPDPVREELVLRQGASLEWLRRSSAMLVGRGRPEEALAVWQPAIDLDPPSVPALVASAHLLLTLGRVDEAGARARRALQLAPGSAEVRSLQGDLLAASGDRRGAIAAYREAIDLDPSAADARTGLARLLLESNRVDEALGQLREAARLRPDSAEIRINLARGLAWADRLPEAAAAAADALAVDPGAAEARALLEQVGQGLWRGFRYAEAIEALDALARAHAATGDLEGALTVIGKAIELLERSAARGRPDERSAALLERMRARRAQYLAERER